MNDRFFMEYRPQDYRVPRSMRDAYGYDARLYVEQQPKTVSGWYLVIGFIGLLVWFSYGWLK